MKKTVFLSLWVLLALPSIGQETPKLTQRIYLWDVTLSMKGYPYDGTVPDVYDDVVLYLEKCINEVKDESTEIYILPFQERVLDTWSANATIEGKKYLINKIKTYQNNNRTNTNISGPINEVKKNIISKSSDRYTFFALLTDGKQNIFGGMQALVDELNSWDQYAFEKHSYLLYVMLTPEAEDTALTNTLDELNYGEGVHPNDSQLDVLDLIPESKVKVNLIDDKYIVVPFSNNSSTAIPAGINVRYSTTGAPDGVQLEGNATIENGAIQIKADYGTSVDSLKLTLPDVSTFSLNMEITNKNDIKSRDKKIILLTNSTTQVELINKPEKTLKISIKK